ncbi:50S ribosomal protein L28 [Facklamia sp. DSM 111018]|uniref:Large ribosomal subunit protein bL28 n=1 Tax=Facklamia lactis TaxID=2749967 RepID=A0ABS0LMX8_9LACT|nr:50S ribosomal protein L28 [Facklamia lactis]MBG9979802.1 50S ribosomal protein L28 [Facklamia lactis]MBG9985518.1 50S ribosomal protein L28 [Facklamia lactis]
MAKECYFSGRKAVSGNARSHSMHKSKRRFGANLQKVRVMIDGKPKKVWVSARALKSGKVERA